MASQPNKVLSTTPMNINIDQILNQGCTISSSGTTGAPKIITRTPANLAASNAVAIESQKITTSSRIYTCCKLTHAGGLLAQTVPAMSIGAHVDIVPFNAWEFSKVIKDYTHTHITPLQAKAIMLTKGFKNLDLTGVWITCGSDPVSVDIIKNFVSRGATFMTNWGMSEIGPITINKIFTSIEQLNGVNDTLLGDTFWCDYKILNNQLYVKGAICIHADWFATGDLVELRDGAMFYLGRVNGSN